MQRQDEKCAQESRERRIRRERGRRNKKMATEKATARGTARNQSKFPVTVTI